MPPCFARFVTVRTSKKASDTLTILIPIFSICIMLGNITLLHDRQFIFTVAAKPVRIATCFDLSTVDQPSHVVTLLLCFVDEVGL